MSELAGCPLKRDRRMVNVFVWQDVFRDTIQGNHSLCLIVSSYTDASCHFLYVSSSTLVPSVGSSPAGGEVP